MKPIILHPMKPEHMEMVSRLHAEQNRRDGTSYPLPRIFTKTGLFTERVPVALVGIAEGEREPVQAIWIERRAELMFAGCAAKATAFARRDIDGLAGVLSWLGYQGLHCDVPLQWAETIRKPLEKAGFTETDSRLAHFFREV